MFMIATPPSSWWASAIIDAVRRAGSVTSCHRGVSPAGAALCAPALSQMFWLHPLILSLTDTDVNVNGYVGAYHLVIVRV